MQPIPSVAYWAFLFCLLFGSVRASCLRQPRYSSHWVIPGNCSENSLKVSAYAPFKWWSLEWHTVGNKWWRECSPNVTIWTNRFSWGVPTRSRTASSWHSLEEIPQPNNNFWIFRVQKSFMSRENHSLRRIMWENISYAYPKSGSGRASSPSWKMSGWWWAALTPISRNRKEKADCMSIHAKTPDCNITLQKRCSLSVTPCTWISPSLSYHQCRWQKHTHHKFHKIEQIFWTKRLFTH